MADETSKGERDEARERGHASEKRADEAVEELTRLDEEHRERHERERDDTNPRPERSKSDDVQ